MATESGPNAGTASHQADRPRPPLPGGNGWSRPARGGTIEVTDFYNGAHHRADPGGDPRGRRPGGQGSPGPGSRRGAGARRAARRGRTAISAALAEAGDEIAAPVAAEVGMPLALARTIQAGLPAMDFGRGAAAGEVTWRRDRQLAGRARADRRGRLHHPVELPAAPDHAPRWRGADGRLHGRVEAQRGHARSTPVVLAEIVDEVGLPAGVFNLVTGYRARGRRGIAGAPRRRHGRFTGSTQAGRRVSEVASQTVKKVALELGGKSANVILDDADSAKAVGRRGVSNCYLNSGPDLQRAHPHAGAELEAVPRRSRWPRRRPRIRGRATRFEAQRPRPRRREAQWSRVRVTSTRARTRGPEVVTGGSEAAGRAESRLLLSAHRFADVSPT